MHYFAVITFKTIALTTKMTRAKLKNVLALLFVLHSAVYCQDDEEMCIPVPRGPAGPPGPQGPPGNVTQCRCEYAELQNEIRSQQGMYLHLKKFVRR